MPGINLQDYVSVAERVNQAKNEIRSIHADAPVMLSDIMGYIRCTVVLKDDRSATGTASFRLDLQGRSAQATNPIEDCETSAIGRALALLGYSSSKSIASREEVQEAQRRSAGTNASYNQPTQTNGKRPPTRAGLIQRITDLEAQLKAVGGTFERKAFEVYTDEHLIELGKEIKSALDKVYDEMEAAENAPKN